MFVLFPELKNNIIFVPALISRFSLSALKYPRNLLDYQQMAVQLQYTLAPAMHIKNQGIFYKTIVHLPDRKY